MKNLLLGGYILFIYLIAPLAAKAELGDKIFDKRHERKSKWDISPEPIR